MIYQKCKGMKKMKKSMMFIVTLVIAGLLLVSCGAPAGTATGADAPGDKTTAAGGEDELNILCFQGYAEDGWLKPFEEKYGCKVNATYAGTVEAVSYTHLDVYKRQPLQRELE